MRTTGVLLFAVLCLAGARSPRADYDKLKMQLDLDSGKRHLDYANLLEDRLGREEAREKFEMRFFKHLDRLDREFPRYLEKMIAQ